MTRMRTGRLVVLVALCAVVCLAAPAMAATWVVNPDGTGDFTTVQAALDSDWTSGDTIEIAYAVYKEPVAVDAAGRELTIMGIPSPAGDLPVIDGMGGTIELPPLDPDGWYGCGECSMFLYNGDFAVSSICVTNASHNGLVARAGVSGRTVALTDVVATENGWHGINIIYYDEAVLTEVDAIENGWAGIHVVSTTFTEGTELLCQDNGDDGLQIRGGEAVLTSVLATGNGYRGVDVILEDLWVIPVDGEECSSALLTDIVATGNARDGLFVKGSGTSVAEISEVESTGNGDDGVVLNGFADFAVSDVTTGGNGAEIDIPVVPPIVGSDDGLSRACALCRDDDLLFTADADLAAGADSIVHDLRHAGNGLFVVQSINGTIESVDATDNMGAGILTDTTGDVVITDCSADANEYLGILTISVSDDYPVLSGLVSDIGLESDTDAMADALDTAFTEMTASVANATVVSEDEFILGEGVVVFVENVTENGPNVMLSSVSANDNGYTGIGVIAPYVVASDIAAGENGVCPTDVAGTLSGAGIVGASFVGEYSGVDAADNGGAGMAAASLVLAIENATLTGNGAEAYSDIHGPLFQTGLLSVSLVNEFLGVHSDQNAGSGILMTSVMTGCYECTASGNDYGGIVAMDPLSLGIAALLVHSDLSVVLDSAGISEEDRFYLESLSSPAMQDVMTCYGETDAFAASATADIETDDVTEEDVAVLIELIHQYMALSGCYMMESGADENGLFGMAVVYPNVAAYGFSADGNGYDGGSTLEALLGTGIFGLYLTGDFFDISVSENSGAGMVTVGVVSEYEKVTADDNGYAGIVTIDPVTLAAAVLGYFVVLDGDGLPIALAADDTADLAMHADITESAVAQEIVATYYTGAPAGEVTINKATLLTEDPMEILLEHIEFYFEYAGVYAEDVSASGNGYPGFVAIGPNVVMNGVIADDNGAANDDESDIIGLAAGSGVIGLSIVGEYIDIAASGNTGAGIATAGVLTDMAACEADGNGVGVVSLFVTSHHTEIGADENSISGIVLAGINGTLTDAAADQNAGPGIVCVDPVAAVLMYFSFSPDVLPSATADDATVPSPETMALVCQLTGDADAASAGSDDRETAWDLIVWAMEYISSYEGDITDLNETEIMDLILTHYLMGAELSVSGVSTDDNGWQGIVVLSPSIVVEDVSASGNGYHGIALISPWKAVDASGFVHPAEPVGAERLSVRGVYSVGNGGAGLSVAGANEGDVMNIYGSENLVGLLLGDSDNLMVSDGTWEANWAASVVCGGSRVNNLIPTGEFLPDGALTDPTGSCDNVFACTYVDGGIVVLSNSIGNTFDETFFDEAQDISADISGNGPYVLYSTCGSWAPPLPSPEPWVHLGGCGIGVVGVGGCNTTVNITYDYNHGFPEGTGKTLYPQWAPNSTTSWDLWRFNPVVNDPVTMTIGPMEVPVTCPADVADGEFFDVMFIAPFWAEERSNDNPGYYIFMQSLSHNATEFTGPGTVPSVTPEAIPKAPVTGPLDGSDDGSDSPGANPQSGADSDFPSSASSPAGVTATATTTPVPTTTPAGIIPVAGAIGILSAVAVLRRR
ncbi:hypothetical protein [Methanogenium organophilum]|uniref:Uncharacterized protein n=1 Tax=Methanogenium organophilum TaxID=2199 RepID=A0A9X9T8I6_METOG|nr:hypothetical protein [Methanogenium organophilum]WAI02513.1 hypothetical protein OU421_06455 [Methanogenium organophilum]